jgi:phage shock protein A
MSDSPYSSEPHPRDIAVPESTPTGDYDEAGVPTFEHVRDKIEGRYATAVGGIELAEESAAGRSIAQQQADRDAAARERLEQIRRSVRGEQ